MCFLLPVFAKNTSNNFFVVKGTEVSGLKNITLKLNGSSKAVAYGKEQGKIAGLKNISNGSLKKLPNVFYLKEKVVFHEEKNTNVKVVYISNTIGLEKGEKVITSYKKPRLQIYEHIHTQLKPFHKLPYNIDFLGFTRSQLVYVMQKTLQSVKLVDVFDNKNNISNLYQKGNYRILNSVVYTDNNFIHKVTKHSKAVLNTTFGRPPPNC